MKLQQVNEALDHRITGGGEYMWNCFPEARYLDYESDYAHVYVLYSTVTQEIYQAEVSVKRDMWEKDVRPYRWLNPIFKDDYLEEAMARNIDPNQAWDDVKWLDLEVEEDFLEKATHIFKGEDWNEGILVPIDLPKDELYQLMLTAHEKNITLNQLVTEILQNMIDSQLKSVV
jgi:hypothetical protein